MEKIPKKKLQFLMCGNSTETSIVNSMHKLTYKDYINLKKNKNIPIGRTHKLMTIKLIDEQSKIIKVPFKIGEICMLGDCVSKGYLGDIENNKNYIFLNNQKAFKTRDSGYFDNYGKLYFNSRMGKMIKISGYRIDALEIQQILSSVESLTNSVVFTQINKNKTKDLCLALETRKRFQLTKLEKN